MGVNRRVDDLSARPAEERARRPKELGDESAQRVAALTRRVNDMDEQMVQCLQQLRSSSATIETLQQKHRAQMDEEKHERQTLANLQRDGEGIKELVAREIEGVVHQLSMLSRRTDELAGEGIRRNEIEHLVHEQLSRETESWANHVSSLARRLDQAEGRGTDVRQVDALARRVDHLDEQTSSQSSKLESWDEVQSAMRDGLAALRAEMRASGGQVDALHQIRERLVMESEARDRGERRLSMLEWRVTEFERERKAQQDQSHERQPGAPRRPMSGSGSFRSMETSVSLHDPVISQALYRNGSNSAEDWRTLLQELRRDTHLQNDRRAF